MLPLAFMLKRYLFFLLPLLLGYKLACGQTHTLNNYITTGLKNSPLLKDYHYQLQSNQVDSLQVYAAYKPQVKVNANAITAPVGQNFGYEEAITDGGNYTGVVSVTQNLFNRKARNVQLENIRLIKQSLAAQQRVGEQDLKRLITAQYLTTYAGFRQMQFSQQVLAILEKEKPALRKLVQNGVYLQTDFLNLQLNINSQAIAYRQAAMQYTYDLYALRILCGIVDTATVILAAPDLQVQSILASSLTPTLQKFRTDSLQLAINRSQIDLNYRYKFAAYADAGVMAIRPQSIARHLGASIGVTLSVPVYDGGQRQLEYQKLTIAEQSRETYRNFYLRQYRMQQWQLQEQLAATDKLLQEMQQQLDSQQNLLNMYKLEIAAGLVRFTDFILVVTNFAQMQNNLVQTEINRFRLINEFNTLK